MKNINRHILYTKLSNMKLTYALEKDPDKRIELNKQMQRLERLIF